MKIPLHIKVRKRLRIDFNKNTKIIFYLKGLWIRFAPKFLYLKDLETMYNKLDSETKKYLDSRIDYYNKNNAQYFSSNEIKTIKAFINGEKKKTYYFDLLEYLKYFGTKRKISYLFGDVIHIPNIPTIVKSRPIDGANNNSIIMKLNKVRHFIFVNDTINFEDKKDMLVWRGKVHKRQASRIEFMQQYFHHPLCDVGQTNTKINDTQQWQKGKLDLKEQFTYKFILAIEGNDVASNLKWAMSSNSLVMMTKPIYETWFMEGTLKPDFHYVLLKDDYSDLEDKIKYYSKNVDKAKIIIQNAHEYIEPFKNKTYEDIISYMVLKKYFDKS